MASASVSTQYKSFWGLKLNLYNFVTMTFFILLFTNRNGKDFSEINIWNFEKSYFAGPICGKSVVESASNETAGLDLQRY